MTAATATPMDEDVAQEDVVAPNIAPKEVLFSPELLGMYYSRLFPFSLLYSWLSYDPSTSGAAKVFSHREFSFTIDVKGEDVYIRYQSFSDEAEFKAAVLQRRPNKIDIGAVFSHPPKDHKAITNGFKTQQRELVFDIDLTDYDEVRKCGCQGAKICGKCWRMMTMAVKVMDSGLREDFGFEHVAWFYSGRRGVHAWICDEDARSLTNEARSAIASYFEVSLGNEKNKQIALPNPLHPMMQRAFSILEPMFIKYVLPCSGHGIMATTEAWTALLAELPDAAQQVRDNMQKKWKSSTDTPAQKWSMLKKHLNIFVSKGKGSSKAQKTISNADRAKIESWPAETVFKYTYPRLDVNVSKMQNHLLKSPFCVHPKTGRVCVPIDADKVDEFDPFSVPTLPRLMRELDEYDDSHNGDKGSVADWEKTSLRKSFAPFQKKFLDPMRNDLRRRRRELEEQKAAASGDF